MTSITDLLKKYPTFDNKEVQKTEPKKSIPAPEKSVSVSTTSKANHYKKSTKR
jgi:hypothetical protein